MPYLGVQTTLLRRVCKEAFTDEHFKDSKRWEALVRELWYSAQYREERHAAINLLEDKRALRFQTVSTLKLYEELIVTGAWWDYADVIAAHRIGHLLVQYPDQMNRHMLKWSKSRDLWKRRASILCQLSFKKNTDLKLLYACIAPSLSSKEFFLQKAIGWALRQYAWTDATEVRGYVKVHDHKLSALSKREALKNIG
ncbi:MAG: DNA alkylation repair protein, partial [Candidatus Obscuribacterales bacterium]|nr:DNA alkylation repair protein [Steroidobacteraceae bacterium]